VWFVPCTWRRKAWVSWFILKTKVGGLSMVLPQNHCDGFLRFGLKTDGDGFSRFVPQNRQLCFGDLGLKITVTVS
jgi:hypothetical protein